MKFCEKCGSYMQVTPRGYSCPHCYHEILTEVVEVKRIEKHEPTPVDLIDNEIEGEHMKVEQECPRCGNAEAFKTASFVSGEHAGVRRERAIQKFRCTKCNHSWTSD